MTARHNDPRSVAGKSLAVQERCDVLVVGAGPAGLAAALEANRLGLSVVLADENPVPAATMGDDVPLHFGGRISGAARNANAMLEAFVASDERIAEAFDAGIDVRLGTTVWGIWVNGPSVGWLPGPVAALASDGASSMLGCSHIIVAAGRRDMGLAFPGWDKRGVMGLTAAERLLRYGALDTRRAVVLGTTAEALVGTLALAAAGIEIAAIIEAAPASIGPSDLLAELATLGIPVLCGQATRRAEGTDEVAALVIAPRDGGPEQRIPCDTIVLAVGTVPLIELLDAAGCRTAWQDARGGGAPTLDGAQTSTAAITAAGDCAGIWPAKTRDPAIATEEGRQAARAAAAALGRPAPQDPPTAIPVAGPDIGAYRLDWVRTAVVENPGEPYVCQCEEVTARDILEVRPPRYLGWSDPRRNRRDLRELLGNGTPNPDQVKRLTRAGMGLCQGRRCREQVAALLALGGGTPLSEVPLATYRAPVRPLPLAVAADPAEDPEMARQWDVWFGMHAQYVPFQEVPPRYTAAGRKLGGSVMQE
jgi:NADPH-dependent 2,4-dienoyl-CoA reductase/sulfur reductase-like enzyme